LFNYGFVEGSISADSLPQDVIVLGPKLPQGRKLDISILGYVQFVDRGVRDDKLIASVSGRIDHMDKIKIRVFFSFYRIFKIIYYIFRDFRIEECRFEGIIVNDMQ
jgi:inorganic pyrophosphatase